MTEKNKSIRNFPNKRNVPKLRFSEFTDEWEENYISEVISSKSKKYNPETNDVNYPSIELESLSQDSGELLSTFDSKNQKSIKNVFNSGDVLFGKLRPYLKKYYLVDFDGVCSSEIWVLKSSILDSNYLYAFVQSNSFISLTEISSGSKMPRADWNLVSSSSIFYPSNSDERKKIGQIIQLLNSRIHTQKKIIEQLETLIKGVGYKLFNKKIRFKNTDLSEFPSWESKKGNDVFSNISNKNHNSELPILAITQEYGAIPRDLIDFKISVTDKSVESYKIVEKGDFIISLRSFQGGIEYSEYKGICSPAYIILRNKMEVNSYFYKYYFKSEYYIKQLNKKLEGIRDGKMISYAYFSDINLPLPSLNEQTKIANFLYSIQEKIETENQILEKLELQKRFLLANLFV
ncbi:restriction endonuclease subunit S [Chryseobacterium indoltheticum]|uniref:Restriction endonuclease subunit S n=1 Tax=Chryseobacterium indoltheticum TaxID=254 RepID=A0A3G6N4Y2_9FLAO|nr:restriction endonuclease subunit S [Chryseobacterium indoltheticum]AZA60079.1 restriction endonuclease subunit S [Chryseobacterium indoltheticum]